jgi:hypothetical protein
MSSRAAIVLLAPALKSVYVPLNALDELSVT